MNFDESNEAFKLSYEFVNNTQRHVYLTGKAGTGKTTFLKYLKEHCKKKMIVLAPTGVAAINAGGVTMHSFFQLPLKPFVANIPMGFGQNEGVADRNSLLKNIRFDINKRLLLKELELVVIDEVSMLRADHLEAIHTILKSYRRNNEAFGGVQMLFIGDLYQLPPVVTENERAVIEQYYNSPYFFDAPIMHDFKPLYIELKKVYRQKEELFINLLNRVRNNMMRDEDYALLHTRYDPHFSVSDNSYVTVTSHNAKADAINLHEMQKLSGKAYTFSAKIDKDFTDKQFPTEKEIVLKEGAQVMFIRNDTSTEKAYYNGKLATVVSLGQEEIQVKFNDSGELFTLHKEVWENIRYKFNEENNEIDENVMGTFSQYPIRLAWAITIHKSQGLTFEKAIIDAGSSFAPGQVYVALSRCTNMEGMVLRSRIEPQAIISDVRIADFSNRADDVEQLKLALETDAIIYQQLKIKQLFFWDDIVFIAQRLFSHTMANKSVSKIEFFLNTTKIIFDKAEEQKKIAEKFRIELESLLNAASVTGNNEPILDRCRKAIGYFTKEIMNEMLTPVRELINRLKDVKGMKEYQKELKKTEQEFRYQLERLNQARFGDTYLFEQIDMPTTEKKKDSAKKEKGSSAKESLAYFMAGKTIEEIAEIKSMVRTTIEGHLSQFIHSGELEVSRFLNEEELLEIKNALPAEPPYLLNELRVLTKEKFSYGMLRMGIAHFTRMSERVDS